MTVIDVIQMEERGWLSSHRSTDTSGTGRIKAEMTLVSRSIITRISRARYGGRETREFLRHLPVQSPETGQQSPFRVPCDWRFPPWSHRAESRELLPPCCARAAWRAAAAWPSLHSRYPARSVAPSSHLDIMISTPLIS